MRSRAVLTSVSCHVEKRIIFPCQPSVHAGTLLSLSLPNAPSVSLNLSPQASRRLLLLRRRSQGGARARRRWRRVGGEPGGAEPGEAVGGGAWSSGANRARAAEAAGQSGGVGRRRERGRAKSPMEPKFLSVGEEMGEREMKQRKKMGKRKRFAPRGSNTGQNRPRTHGGTLFARYVNFEVHYIWYFS